MPGENAKTSRSILRHQVFTRLKEFGFDPALLCEKINAYHAFITGSFALQVVLSERYDDSDLDIFCSEHAATEIIRACLPKGYTKIKNKETSEKYPLVKNNYGDIRGIQEVKTYQKGTCKVQFVVVKGDVEENIKGFDLSFCQTRFDGEKFIVPQLGNTLNKIGYLKTGVDPKDPRQSDRIAKYKKRGFTIYQKL